MLWMFAFFLSGVLCQHNPNFVKNDATIVHLFEWKWKDIAQECENFLQHHGYGAVQISPPNENLVLNGRPWYERYQPISYKLATRSGNEEDFKEMTKRCNAVGIRIYVDTVINHMTGGDGVGTAGNRGEASTEHFPGVPYDRTHFHKKCSIHDYNNPVEVRTCELLGLTDLDQGQEYVKQKIVDFMNKLIDLGVAGFRVDAAKHMFPNDLKAIYDKLKNLNEQYGFPPNSRAFIYQEIAGQGYGEAVTRDDYTSIGNVMEFRYGLSLGKVFLKKDKARYLQNWGPAWNLVDPGSKAVVFIDNHDNQRDGSADILTYKLSKLYKMAIAFMMAHPYGIARIMSSYDFVDSQTAPPHDRDGNLISPGFRPDLTCTNGYICEHRWRQIYQMSDFRVVVANAAVARWQTVGDHQVAFCRGDKGFVAFSNDLNFDREMDVCVPAGTYCDVISGSARAGKCTGKVVRVNANRRAQIVIKANDEDGVLAIHVGAKID